MTALAIGNAAYPDGQDLANPANDAGDFGAKLSSYGFDTIVATDCRAREMDKHLKSFGRSLDEHDVGLFFFAGHGMQIEGVNYLIALDTDMDTETDAKHTSLSLDKVVDVMARSAAATKIIILDACRKNPWERRWHRAPGVRGLASVYAPKGTIIGFATSPGEVAFDGVGRNGTYTAAILQHIDTPDCSIEAMFKRVRNEVAAASGDKQTTWEHTSLSAEFYFNMSLGKLIEAYGDVALADGLLVIDGTRRSHKIIRELKSHDWYRQNPAVASLDADLAAKISKDNLFVIGRNVYQAACGRSNAAVDFVRGFARSTGDWDKNKRKALLDGMLFEVFFDPEGKLRDDIKKGVFSDLFELERHSEFKASFDFISEALIAAGGDFYVLPGKGHELAVTVAIRTKTKGPMVDAIYVDGTNVLRPTDDAWDRDDGEAFSHRLSRTELEDQLSVELVVPERLLRVSCTPADSGSGDQIRFPMGWTVKKA